MHGEGLKECFVRAEDHSGEFTGQRVGFKILPRLVKSCSTTIVHGAESRVHSLGRLVLPSVK